MAQWIAYLLLAQRPRVVEIYRQHALLRQWTVQSLIVDRTHPVLVRAVLQKKTYECS